MNLPTGRKKIPRPRKLSNVTLPGLARMSIGVYPDCDTVYFNDKRGSYFLNRKPIPNARRIGSSNLYLTPIIYANFKEAKPVKMKEVGYYDNQFGIYLLDVS